MSGDDLPITIRLSQIADHLTCPVCMCQLKDTASTPCGHRYCYDCVKECIGRHHKCPVCNQQLTVKQIIKDKAFDQLISIINGESEKSETQYFDSLINSATPSTSSTPDHEEPQGACFSPVETVLKKHLKESLVIHERYYQDLKKDFQSRMEQTEAERERKRAQIQETDAAAIDSEREMYVLEEETEQQKATLREEMDRCSQLVAQAYDRYLSAHVPNLSILPVRVTLNVLNKNIQIEDVEIKPHDSLTDIQRLLIENMEEKGDKIVKLGEDVKFLVFGPFAKRSQYEMVAMATDVIEHNATHSDMFVLQEGTRPVMQLAMKNGSHIAIYGQLQCESDLPKKCFAASFQPGNLEKVDYFSCKDCRINWICRSCMDVCHKEHAIVPYIMGHQPTWACCYCPKKKKCTMEER